MKYLLFGIIVVKAGYGFGQPCLDPVQYRTGFKTGRKLFLPVAVPAGAFYEITDFKIKFIAVGCYFVHNHHDRFRAFYEAIILDVFVKSRDFPYCVTPAEAG
ncbi:MAG: hypothetical protein ACLFS7_09870, partial [Desulfosudaceae bacterium]